MKEVQKHAISRKSAENYILAIEKTRLYDNSGFVLGTKKFAYLLYTLPITLSSAYILLTDSKAC